MHTVRKHVIGLYVPRPVSGFRQDPQVPRKGGGVAGHVDDVRGRCGQDRVKQCALTALARRVNDDEVRLKENWAGGMALTDRFYGERVKE